MILDRIRALLEACTDQRPLMPATQLYNERWLLRLVMDWCARRRDGEGPLPFLRDATWFSDGLLPSAFLPRHCGDHLAEGWTHADGVIGHFDIGSTDRGDVVLRPDARQLVVVEAKMLSPMSRGTRNAPDFDEAARNVACIAETLRRGRRAPDQLESLSFVLVAPAAAIADGAFGVFVTASSIHQKVQHRVASYAGERDAWFHDWFEPTLDRIELRTVAWEDLVARVVERDTDYGQALSDFYQSCIRFNRPRLSSRWRGAAPGCR